MPIFDFECKSGHVNDHYLHNSAQVNPPCDNCGEPTERRSAHRFGAVFTGDLGGKYLDKKLDGGHNRDGGHYVYRTRDRDGQRLAKPTREYISTFQQQAAFCKAEGLINPKDAGKAEISSDGKSVNGIGVPGCEI